jgi:uncharacterized membrane protein
MIKAATAINSFASKAEPNGFVPPEEPIFVLTGSQLQNIISRAIQPLQDEVQSLKATVANLEDKASAMEATQDTQAENELNMLRLINDLRKDKEPQPLQKDRGEILRALLAANGGKMLAKEARQKMHLSKSLFSQLLATIKNDIEVRPYHLNKNWKVLVLR